MEYKYQLRMAFAGGWVDFAELPCGKWEWDSEEELRADWDALMLYIKKRKAVSYYITESWGSEDSDDEEMDYEIIWDSTDE